MNSKINVLQICSFYIGTKLYQNLFTSLETTNIKEDIYIFTHNKNEIKENNSTNIYISKCYNKYDRLIFHLKHAKVLNEIKKRMKIDKYDVIHAHSLFSNGYIAYKLNQKYNIPYIVAVRNTDVNLFFKKMFHLRNMGVNILRDAKKVIFISDSYKNYTIDKYIPTKYRREIEEKSVVIPNGIDEFWLKNKHKERDIPKSNKIRLIYIGNVDNNKNIETTVKACNLLIEKGYEVSYTVIGKIKSSKYIELINKHSFINYIPYCQKEELIDYYRKSDIFIMPSKHETFGLVYAEAMSQGLPIVYTKGQGFDGQFEEGIVGYHVECLNAEEIVYRIVDIFNNYREISANCVEQSSRFNWDLIVKEYLNIYEDVKNIEDTNNN